MKHIWIGMVCLAIAGQGRAGTLRLKNGAVDTSSLPVKTMSLALPAAVQQETLDGKICQLVQFRATPSGDDQKQLQALGGEIVGYVPDHAFLVLIDSAKSDLPQTLSGVEWVGSCFPEYKVSAALDMTQPELEVVISLLKPGFLPRVEWWIEQQQGTVVDSGKSTTRASIRATLSADSVAALAELAEVEWIEPFIQMEVFNNVAVEAPRMNVKTVWETHGLTGAGQVVAVGDTGLDLGNLETIHPDFSGRIRYASSYLYGDNWKDYNGHGTHVAGSVLGDGSAFSNGLYRGVAYESELVMQALGDNSGTAAIYGPSPLGILFEEAYTNGARIHHNSWGADAAGAYTSQSRDVDDFMWQNDDMLIVFSAGNAGEDANGDGVIDWQSLGVPGTAKNCLTVGAAESDRPAGSGGYSSKSWGGVRPVQYSEPPIRDDLISTSDDGVHQGMAAFSSRGPCADGRIKPDVVAPGTDIISCRARDGASDGWGLLSGEAGEYYKFSGGTSMSGPLVSGVAALARQYFEEYHSVPNPSAALLKAALINGAVSLYPGQYGTNDFLEIPNTTGNNVEGWGQVNAGNTFFPEGKENVFWDRNRLQTSEKHIFELNVTGTNGLSTTLVWSDPPASLLSSLQLVNDLDLILISPSGVTNRPNGLVSADHTNNVEQVDLAVCETGLWTMVVSGYSVPEGPQSYALFSSFSGDAGNTFEVTSVWHEPTIVVGAEEPVDLFASLTTGGKALAGVGMSWREDDGAWKYQAMSFIATNGENLVYSTQIQPSSVGAVVDYYAYALLDLELITSPTNQFGVNSPVLYVSTSGSQTWPYDSLERAYTNLNQAFNAALPGREIRVDDGSYEVQLMSFDDDITLTSLNGPGSTILDFTAQNYPGIILYAGTVSGVTIQGGLSPVDIAAGGVTVAGGTLSNCWVRNNFSYYLAGGVYLYDGLVKDCRIENNLCYYYGGGLLTRGGLVENSIIDGNQSGLDAGGVEVWGGTIRNCTFVNNYAGGYGGGVDIGDVALVENCIVLSNNAALGGDNWYEWVPMNMRYSCTTPLPSGIGNMDIDPLFADFDAGDYHLRSTYGRFAAGGWVVDSEDSPCIDFGNPLSDASREPTVSRVNMGAYGNTAEASRSGTNETRLIVQAVDGATDPAAGVHIYSPEDFVAVSLADDPFTVGTTQYQFSAWSTDNSWARSLSTNESLDLSMTNNWIVRVSHDLFYRADLYAGTNGTVAFSNGWYAANSMLSATATPDLYYVFDEWAGENTSVANNPLTIQLTRPVELYARFVLGRTASGVPHWWLGQYGFTNNYDAVAAEDPDGDGAQTWQEYVAGTQPFNSNSVLRLNLEMQPGTNSLSWMAQADRTYTLYYGTNLTEGINNVLVEYYSIFPMPLWLPDYLHADQPSVFYRLEVEYDGD
ncbi:S8 family serine peptidase [Tichowtungia aerotolerans]|uniref:S8 family serine peptidase n=1 Tax=Tichowtungia aerotolerans TaxID=2697043 RepID=A0A6P1M9Y8_9BACT|nr:S8 family serine peptidase [Tichowtungia aerotolerans]QHI67935.1 S8 family serine peptidase [Tichowtungia aerotolerans]